MATPNAALADVGAAVVATWRGGRAEADDPP
jgi:hypothetical protein